MPQGQPQRPGGADRVPCVRTVPSQAIARISDSPTPRRRCAIMKRRASLPPIHRLTVHRLRRELAAIDGFVPGRPIEGLQRGERGGQSGHVNLGDVLGVVQVLQAVLAEVAEGGPVGKVVLHQGAGGPGDQDLAAVPGRGDARGAVHVDADVALVREQRLPGVKTHPHADGSSSESIARLGRRSEGIRGLRKGDEERVTLRIHLHAVVSRERVA